MISSKNLKYFAELLEDHDFIRIYHSFLVNANHITTYSRQGEIFLTDKIKAPLGDSFRNEFIKRFGKS